MHRVLTSLSMKTAIPIEMMSLDLGKFSGMIEDGPSDTFRRQVQRGGPGQAN